jgi:hypothetical protein
MESGETTEVTMAGAMKEEMTGMTAGARITGTVAGEKAMAGEVMATMGGVTRTMEDGATKTRTMVAGVTKTKATMDGDDSVYLKNIC